jgi:hypothetical protein
MTLVARLQMAPFLEHVVDRASVADVFGCKLCREKYGEP